MTDDDKPRRDGARTDHKSGKPMRSHGFKDKPGQRPPRRNDDRPGSAKPPRKDGARGFRDRPGPDSVKIKPLEDVSSPEPTAPERIAKRLARAGIASRREAETIIAAGRVSVNGKTLTSPAFNVTLEDRILVDGKPIPQIERTRLWLYHKPAGLVTSNKDPEGRPTVFENLPGDLPRVLSVGRLDINTEGLLLLTNDGGLSRALELPQTGWLRRYRVRAHGRITQKQLDELKNGIAVDGVFYGAIHATLEREQGSNVWIEMAIREGKNREIKNVLGALGLDVNRLIRVSYGPFQLADLAEGHVLEVRGRVLRDQLGEALIEQSGANFDAPVISAFPNKPVAKSRAVDAPAAPTVTKRGDWISASREQVRSGKKPDRPDRKDMSEPLSRLSTKAPRPKGGKPDDRPERPEPRSRGSNVWMAPGARPQGRKSRGPATAKPPRNRKKD